MVVKSSPAYARVVLGEALRNKRAEKGLSQAEVAEWLGQKQPKIAKLESADLQRIKMAELNVILDNLGIVGQQAEELRGYARTPYTERGTHIDTSGSAPWWNGKARGEVLARQYMSYHLETWDGLAQHESYMRRLFELSKRTNVDAATKVRLERQRRVYESERPGEFRFVVSEGALMRDMDDPAMMADQLEHVLRLADQRDFISVQVVPFTASIPTQTADFTIMKFESYVMSDLALVEHDGGLSIQDDLDSMRAHERNWVSITGGALSEYDSRQKIQQRIDHYRAPVKEK